MTTNFDDIYPRLDQSGDFVQANPPVPQPQQPQAQPPVDPKKAARDAKMQEWQNLITNFTFSLGLGLEASAKATGGPRNRTYAGTGAALQAPLWLQEIQQKNRMAQAQLEAEQLKSKMVPLIGPNGQPITGADQQPLMIPATQSGSEYLKGLGIQSADERARLAAEQRATDSAAKLKAEYAKQGRDENGNPLPEDKLDLVTRQRLADAKVADDLRRAQTEAASAKAALDVAKNDPNSPVFKQAQDRYDAAIRHQDEMERIANENLGLHARSVAVQEQRAAENTQEAKLGAGLEKEAISAEGSYKALTDLAKQKTRIANNLMLDQLYNVAKPEKGGRFTIAERNAYLSGAYGRRADIWLKQFETGEGAGEVLTDQMKQEILNAAKVIVDAKRGSANDRKPKAAPPPSNGKTGNRMIYDPRTGLPKFVEE